MRLIIALMLSAIITSRISFADGNKVSAGLLAGLSIPSLSSGAFGWGLTAAYRFLPSLMAGVFYYTYGLGLQAVSGDSSLTASTTNVYYGTQALVDFTGGFSAGIKSGIIKIEPNVTATDSINTVAFTTSTSYFFIGPVISYDYPLATNFSVGGEISYLYTLSGDAPKVVTLLGAAKLNF